MSDFKSGYVFRKKRWQILIPLFDSLLIFKPKVRLKKPKRILVFRADGIGDAVLTLPLIETMARTFPEANLSVCVPPECSDLLQGHPAIEHILTFKGPWFDRKEQKSIKKFIKYLSLFAFDTAFEPRGDLRHILLLKKAGIRQIIGFGITGGKRLLAYCANYERGVPVWQNHLQLLKPFGAQELTSFSLRETESDVVFCKALKQRFGNLPRPFIAAHPFAGSLAKQWPLHYWKELLKSLHAERGGTLFLLGKRSDESAMEYIGHDGCQYLPELFGIREVLLFLKTCDLFIGVDSGIAHLAALAKVPSVLLFSGTNDPREYAPMGERQKILSEPVPCAPCEKRLCPVAGHPCMSKLSVKKVLQEALAWLS